MIRHSEALPPRLGLPDRLHSPSLFGVGFILAGSMLCIALLASRNGRRRFIGTNRTQRASSMTRITASGVGMKRSAPSALPIW